MQLKFKNNFLGYFHFYYSVIGNKLYRFIFINMLVGLLDGIGLSMFIPLLSIAFGGKNDNSQSLGKLHYFIDALQKTGISVTVSSVLVLLIVLFSLKGLMRYFQMQYMAQMRFSFITKIRSELLNMLGNVKYRDFLQLDSGTIQNSLLSEMTRLYGTMSNYFWTIQYAVMVLTYIVLAFLANYRFAFLVIVGAALSNILYKKIFSNTQKASIKVSQKGNQFNSFLVQAINHFRYLKATDYFRKYAARLNEVIKETEDMNLKIGRYQALSEGTKEPIAVAIICIVVYIQFYFFKGNMNSVFVSLLLFYRSLTQLSQLQSSRQSFIQNIGSMYAISNMAESLQAMQEDTTIGKPVANIGTIRLENVSLTYDSAPVLENISMKVEKNTTIAFIGESGSGKTSLAHLMIGLFPPTKGNVFIDNQNLQNINIHAYRNKIGYISQDAVIFNDTIFNNVTFFDTPLEANIQRFWKALQLASLSDFVQSLPLQEHTVLGDNGMLISGGQKQRISIARELYKECELLILDEATSALDSETENIIRENIEQLQGKYTIIVIAHRLSTVKKADTIYLLKNKKITASGSFEELLTASDEFKKIINAQAFQ
ncbi:hypothetical protein A9P82_07050 [Arachidicoccus ginsenosidimutans]|uniref:ABC transporter ATP-binding protein n=1 Tax=Arachidicoccus sp. BS20 TaxID=1850526 RepID=UPI0007F09D42|nr:ABC transporter ATP-binding protein [Arachidicoccus sp. BS20]ANI89066.1 hypothetical protein A9P82_07050 [Arachidicoccus sp. BS20]